MDMMKKLPKEIEEIIIMYVHQMFLCEKIKTLNAEFLYVIDDQPPIMSLGVTYHLDEEGYIVLHFINKEGDYDDFTFTPFFFGRIIFDEGEDIDRLLSLFRQFSVKYIYDNMFHVKTH